MLQQGAAGAQAHPCPPGLQPHSVLQQVLQQGSVMVVAVLGGGGKRGRVNSDGIENCECARDVELRGKVSRARFLTSLGSVHAYRQYSEAIR